MASSLLFVAYRYLRIRNVYDEIYYDEMSYLNFLRYEQPFIIKMDGTELIANDENKDAKIKAVSIFYNSSHFISDGYLNISANNQNELIIIYQESLDSNKQLLLFESYDVKTKKLTQTLRLSDDNIEGYDVPNSQIKSYLSHYGLTESDIQERFKLIETVFLQEWSDKYKSRFSAGYWGDVKVIKKW